MTVHILDSSEGSSELGLAVLPGCPGLSEPGGRALVPGEPGCGKIPPLKRWKRLRLI